MYPRPATLLLTAALWFSASVSNAQGIESRTATAQAFDTSDIAPRNGAVAVAQLCRWAREGKVDAQYDLAWIFAHGRGAEQRNDWAAYLFRAAASMGHEPAAKMLTAVSWPASEMPACLNPVGIAVAAQTVPATSAGVEVMAPPYIERMVRKLAPTYRVDPQLVLSIIAVESNFNVAALSPRHAMGLMQLIPATADRFGVRNAFDMQQNLRGGMAYLRWLLAYFEGDVALVAAAYNAGEGMVERHRGVPPFEETREYVRRIVGMTGRGRQHFDARVTQPSPHLRAIRDARGAMDAVPVNGRAGPIPDQGALR